MTEGATQVDLTPHEIKVLEMLAGQRDGEWGAWVAACLEALAGVDTWDVWERTGWLAGINGARCTIELKVVPRLQFQRPDDIHVFGYTADQRDVERAKALRENYPELTIETPLIERGITKAACLAMIERAGIAPPVTYALGLPNANCLPCVKATSPAYWALIRKLFPEIFDRIGKLSRRMNVRLCRLPGDVRAFIDEIPEDFPTTDAIVPSCDFLCALAEGDFARPVQPEGDGR